MTTLNNPNGILNPGRFVFYERLHKLTTKLMPTREQHKLLFRVTTAYLDQNHPQYKGLWPIEVLVTSTFHCLRLLNNTITMRYSMQRISEVAMEEPFADGNAVRVDECIRKEATFPTGDLAQLKRTHDELTRVLTSPQIPEVTKAFTAVLVDNYVLENLLVRGNEARLVLAAQLAATRIFFPLHDITGAPGRYYQECLQLGMKVINSVKKRSNAVVAQWSNSLKRTRTV